MDIKDLPIVITGAASGMGQATARYLANLGAKVTLLDVNTETIEKLANEIGGLALYCDVTSEENVKSALSELKNKFGSLRVCVNCAGVIVAKRLVGKKGPMSLDDFNKAISVNLIGSFNMMRLCAEFMQHQELLNKEERGLIINTASIAAFEGQIGQVAYSASKGGVVGMTLPAARELASCGIRVVAVAPGLIETPMLTSLPDAAQQQLLDSTIFPKRLGKPEEYSKLIAHIIDNQLINGEVIRLDGGVRLN